MEIIKDSISEAWEESIVYLIRNGSIASAFKRNILEINNISLTITKPNSQEKMSDKYVFTEKFKELHVQKLFRGESNRAYLRIHNYNEKSIDQLEFVKKKLKYDPTTKEAIISIYDPILDNKSELASPCHLAIYFLNKKGRLYVTATFKIVDAWLVGLPDIYQLIKIQEEVASALELKLGELRLIAYNYFIFENDIKMAKKIFLGC